MADSNESNPNTRPTVRIRRMARALSILTVTISCFLFAIAGCCFLAALVFHPKVDTTSKAADALAAGIVDWTLPPDFSGELAYTLDNPIFLFDAAKFVHQQGRGHLVIARLTSKFPGAQIRMQDLMDQIAPELKKLNIEDPQKRSTALNGDLAEFEIGRGEDRASTTKYRQVVGHFRGKRDASVLNEAILILQCEDDVLTDEQIEEFLKSIR